MVICRYLSTFFVFAVLTMVLLFACGKDSPTKPTETPVASRIEITPSSARLNAIGQTVQLTVTVYDQNNNPMSVAGVEWSSGDASVATVSAQGLLTAVSNGVARITANWGSLLSGIDATVMQTADSIVIGPDEVTLMSIGETVQLIATVLDGNGQSVEGAVLTWSSSDPSVATVSAQGLVMAVSDGVARISATSDIASDSITVTVQVRTPSPDRDVLVALYNALDGENWKKNTNWLSNRHVDDWFGVDTDESGRVTALNLGVNGLRGSLPVELSRLSSLEGLSLEGNFLTGAIPTELGQLAGLTLLYIFDNQLTGPIPAELGQLDKLIHLCLNGNQLTGPVPPELGSLSNLRWLHLHDNVGLTGSLPAALTALELDALLLQNTQVCLPDDIDLKRWVSRIPDARVSNCEGFSLERIALEALYNATNGPEWHTNSNWLSDRPIGEWFGVGTDDSGQVIRLELASNRLTGSIPKELGNLTNLEVLDLSRNTLAGTFPEGMGQLTKLEKLTLQNNSLTGHIPPELGQLTSLNELRLSYNRLEGSIPAELGQLAGLRQLYLEANRLTGSIPSEIGNLTDLVYLWLDSNKLTGVIPAEIGNLADLVELYISDNQLVGSIPSTLGRLAKLNDLFAHNNQLSGVIPAEIGQLAGLRRLLLNNNQLTGSIPPELGQLSDLEFMNLWNNKLDGSIPPELGKLGNLEVLELGVNGLTGSIPPELGELSRLRSMGFSENHLSGSIPSELGQLGNLTHLELHDNALSGDIPPAIGRMTALVLLDLGNNPALTGSLPVELIDLRSLMALYLDQTQVCIPPDTEFKEWLLAINQTRVNICETVVPDRDPLVAFYDATGGTNWTSRDNWLSDQPLDQWFGVTTNDSLGVERLTLAGNNLAGGIPRDLGRLSSLRVLDLSGNPSLEGQLPGTVTELPLEILRLDGTQLCAPREAEFEDWMAQIPQKSGILNCDEEVVVDRHALISFYTSTNGQNWRYNWNWLSDRPLGDWHGVSVDSEERVVKLELFDNNLKGSIPPAIGGLEKLTTLELALNSLEGVIPADLGLLTNLEYLNLDGNNLWGSIPSEIGLLQNLKILRLAGLRLTGGIPAELGNLTKLKRLDLSVNQLTGPVPSELGKLYNLERLDIGASNLSGRIPAELGNLTKLTRMNLNINQLTGPVPSELGRLVQLRSLDLRSNQLTGPVPSELGRLIRLRSLELNHNQLTGGIPPEFGRLSSLENLRLTENRLTGGIPAELGKLSDLKELRLHNNRLTGSIPPELGRLRNLIRLELSANMLEGSIPTEFGELTNLEVLLIGGNRDLTGPVPVSLVDLDLDTIDLDGTLLCLPPESGLQDWYNSIAERSRIIECRTLMNTEVYLTQAVQSFQRAVPLVEGEPALLRVFFATEETVSNRPPVKAVFYHNGVEVHSTNVPAGPAKIPDSIFEGNLDLSSNVMVPAWVISPGLELVVEVDPEGGVDPESGIAMRIPEMGRMPVDVQTVPPLHLTLVPMLSIDDPNYEVQTAVEGLKTEDDIYRDIRNLLPVQDDTFRLTIHEPLLTSQNIHPNNSRLTIELHAVRAMEGVGGHYMGIVSLATRGGIADRPGFVSVSVLDAKTMAHELGHNFVLHHAPCNTPDPDPYYPYEDGSIGAWGYDIRTGRLIDASTPDIMGYCFSDAWISDYHFNSAIRYRLYDEKDPIVTTSAATRMRSLLLWGGLDGYDTLILEPAFVVDAAPYLPGPGGPYRIEAEDSTGNTLFSLNFTMNEVVDGDGGGGFAFIVPLRPEWSNRLERITLGGPEGLEEMTAESGRSAALLLDRSAGTVRGILREWSGQESSDPAARRLLPEPGIEIIVSHGIPR